MQSEVPATSKPATQTTHTQASPTSPSSHTDSATQPSTPASQWCRPTCKNSWLSTTDANPSSQRHGSPCLVGMCPVCEWDAPPCVPLSNVCPKYGSSCQPPQSIFRYNETRADKLSKTPNLIAPSLYRSLSLFVSHSKLLVIYLYYNDLCMYDTIIPPHAIYYPKQFYSLNSHQQTRIIHRLSDQNVKHSIFLLSLHSRLHH